MRYINPSKYMKKINSNRHALGQITQALSDRARTGVSDSNAELILPGHKETAARIFKHLKFGNLCVCVCFVRFVYLFCFKKPGLETVQHSNSSGLESEYQHLNPYLVAMTC